MSRASDSIAPPLAQNDAPMKPAFVPRPFWLRYAVAAAAVTLTFFIILALTSWIPWLGRQAPFAPFLAVILAIAYWAGPGPGLLATFFSAILGDWLMVKPGIPFYDDTLGDSLRVGLSTGLGVLVCWVSAAWHSAHAALSDREQKLRILLDKMPVVLWSTDTALKLTSSSAAMGYLFDAAAELRGPGAPALAGEFFQSETPDFLPVAAQRRAVAGEAVSYDLAADDRFFHVHVEPLRAPDGSITGSFGMAWDITAQHRAETIVSQANQDLQARVAQRTEQMITERAARAEAEAANRAKDEFFAVLSHELRSPMTPVLMTISSLENDLRLPEEVRSSLRMARRNVELEARLIDDLLDLTRISKGKIEMTRRELDVHSLLCHARDGCRADAEARDLRIDLSAEASRCFVRGDATRLQQVFWNLLRNAVKFTPDGGSIHLRTFNDAAGQLVVQVSDTGIGIEAEVLPRIFTAFEQGGRDMTRRYGGLGLGLAISKALVDLHGGTLTADSEGRGKGSTFTVTLPTVDAPIADSSPRAAPTKEAAPLRILLVEDHADTRKATARLLRLLGHDVATAESVATGLQVAESRRFDLVISDLGLPDGSGLDLMRQIKQRYGLKGIALSGYGMESDLRSSRDAGFDHHLIKPVPLEQLQATVREVAGMGAERVTR